MFMRDIRASHLSSLSVKVDKLRGTKKISTVDIQNYGSPNTA